MMMFQDVTGEFCWGTVWARPTLGKKIRAALSPGMTAPKARPARARFDVLFAAQVYSFRNSKRGRTFHRRDLIPHRHVRPGSIQKWGEIQCLPSYQPVRHSH